MPVVFRRWPAWIWFATGLPFLAHDAQSQTSAPAEPVPLADLYMQTRAARLAGDHKAWLENGQRLLRLDPEHPDFLVSVARALAANGRPDDAVSRVEEAARRGAGFDLATLPEFKSLPASPRLNAVREQALRNLAPVAPPEVFLALANESLQPEGITWDPVDRYLYMGSLNGEIWRVALDGKLERFAGPDSGLREVLGLKVDAERRLLWAVTGVFPDIPPPPEPKKDMGITALHAYDLDTRKRVRECTLDERPTLHGFNDMALAKDGQVYVTDTSANSIYALSVGGCRFDRIVHDAAMTFPNGIALTSDGSRLYVAHVEGISAVDLRSRRRVKLSVPDDAAVNSIDGLAWDGKDLLGVQNSPYFARVARIRLADDGLSVRRVTTMSSRPPLDLTATTGVVVGDQFYMVAGFRGAPAAGGQQPHRAVLRSRVR